MTQAKKPEEFTVNFNIKIDKGGDQDRGIISRYSNELAWDVFGSEINKFLQKLKDKYVVHSIYELQKIINNSVTA